MTQFGQKDFYLEIARGNVPGMSVVNKFGQATNGIQTSLTDVWDRADATPTQQIWLAPTAARTHTITSSNAADDGTPEGAGGGAQAIRIWYLPDWATAETTEDVILNGTGNVAMGNAAVIINRMKVIPVGATYEINQGNIIATAATDTTVSAQINIGKGQTEMAIYGVPSIQTLFLDSYEINSHNTGNPSTPTQVDFMMLINERPDLNTTVFITKSNKGMLSTGTNDATRRYSPQNKIPGPFIIKYQAIATASDSEATVEFDGILIDN